MNYIELSKTGEQVSEMCLGTMMFGDRCDETETDRILSAALDAGVTFIDTAEAYCQGRTEEILGRILNGKRERLFIATKVRKGIDGKSILEGLDESLARLQLDYVDLYLIHWPKHGMRPIEVMEALDRVVRQGKTRYVGCCNYPAWLFAYSNAIAAENNWTPLICNQIPYNLIERGAEVEVLPQAVACRTAITTYRPLVAGLLTGKYQPGKPIPIDSRGYRDARIRTWLERYSDAIQRFNQFAAKRGIQPAELAIAWVRYSPAVTAPIVGVSSLHQLKVATGAFDFDLSDNEYAEVTRMFDTAVKEEAGGKFPELRRTLDLVE